MNIIKILKNLNEPNINKEFFNSKNKKKNLEENIEEMVRKFKKNELKYLKTLNIIDCKKILIFLNKSYINLNPIISNEYYDILKNYIMDNEKNYDHSLSLDFLKNYKI